MTSNPPIEPQDAATVPSSSTPVNALQMNITNKGGGDIRVLVTEQAPEGWFKVLRSLVRSGQWGEMLDRHRSVLMVMHELRRDDTGIAYAPLNDCVDEAGVRQIGLRQLSGQGRSACYQAINDFCTDPASLPLDAPGYLIAAAGLLARRGPDRYAVLPGRIFAGRRPDQAPSRKPLQRNLFEASSATVDDRPPRRTGVHPRGPGVRHGGRSSIPADDEAATYRETQARSNEIIERTSSSKRAGDDDDAVSIEDFEKAVDLLMADWKHHKGFKRRDAERNLEESGATLEDVRLAIENAKRNCKGSWRGYIRTLLHQGCSVPAAIEAEQYAAIEVQNRLRRCADLFGDEASCDQLDRWARTASNRRLADLATHHTFRSQDDEGFWAHVTRKVSIEIPG
jgi:hypothetical protein